MTDTALQEVNLMKILRQNTDYALRAMANLAFRYGEGAVSTRRISEEEGISYEFAAKIMQDLHAAGLVESTMGPKGGFSLARAPEDVTLLEVVSALQGEVCVNKCFLRNGPCRRRSYCAISSKIAGLQEYIEKYLSGITLGDLLDGDDDNG